VPPGCIAGPRLPLSPAAAAELLRLAGSRSAILVEGWSDQAAVEGLARRRGIDLREEGIGVVPIGGITNMGKFIDALGPRGAGLRLGGLCDAAEAPYLMRTLQNAGLTEGRTDEPAERFGFFICHADLEDELIRAVGPSAVEDILEREGELASFRRFQDQPAQRGRALHAHLHRFMGTRAQRKIRYGTLLVEALRPDRVPPSLDRVLARLRSRDDADPSLVEPAGGQSTHGS
jgi:hypothetical protein